jgi:uncharacterized protein YdhG (YjbR/CyaY superfamily)
MQAKIRKPNAPRAKNSTGPMSVEAYLAAVPEPARTTLRKVRAVIRKMLPQATEVISYGMPAFRYKGRGVMCYAAFKEHCSVFPGAILQHGFEDVIQRYRTSKGTIQFPRDKPLPAAVIKRLVKARVAMNEAKARS